MTNPIISDLRGSDLDVTTVVDPARVKLYRDSIAKQMNGQRLAQDPPKTCLDLSNWISDIIIETTAQGASLLQVDVIDPGWVLIRRDVNGTAYFDVDTEGYLWPPITVNFPPDVSDAQWVLCQIKASTDVSGANLTLTFEDKVAATLREFSGPVMSNANETRAEFIKRLVKEATIGGQQPTLFLDKGSFSKTGGAGSTPEVPIIGTPDGKIRFIPLLPNVDFTKADLTADQQTKPRSARHKNAPTARKNPNKKPGTGVAKVDQSVVEAVRGVEINIVNGLSFSPGTQPSQPGHQPNILIPPVFLPTP